MGDIVAVKFKVGWTGQILYRQYLDRIIGTMSRLVLVRGTPGGLIAPHGSPRRPSCLTFTSDHPRAHILALARRTWHTRWYSKTHLDFVSNNAIKFKITDCWLRSAQNITALSNTVTLTKRITGIFATSERHFITRCWNEEMFRFYHLSPQSVHRPSQRLSNVFILWQFGVAVKIPLTQNVSHAIKL